MVALVSVLSGAFSRHGNIVRPLVAIVVVVGLLASGLVIQNIAARFPALIPLIWIHAIAPGLVCAVMLYGPALSSARPARPARPATA
jgi:lipopolysaccharide export system permease protein